MSVTVDLHEGLELGEHLRLLRPLAQGGMAQLWVAEHRTLGIEVVVKILTARTDADTAGLQRFRREGRITAKVRSLHVVRVFDGEDATGPEQATPFLVLELLHGEDLSSRIARKGWLSLEETATIVDHVALALEKAHGMGIVHRDVKPGNVFLADGPGGTIAKLVDFGIAKDASEPRAELTRAGSLMGTPLFMSPEQVAGTEAIDERCDLWSLAVVAYACLTGKLPFGGDSFGAVCIAVHVGRFEPPSTARPALSPAIDAFFASALHRTLELRPRGARELSEAFREAAWSDANLEKQDGCKAVSAPAMADGAQANATTVLSRNPADRLVLRAVTDNVPFDLDRPRSRIRVVEDRAWGRAARGRT